jgi:pSer/pThr/pTyr-binding forkhead associated (FHA) protein
VSSYHANVLRTADGFVVIDLGSSNGTFVNGIRVQESVIQDEDEVYFGLCRTVFRGGTFVEVSAER